MSFGLYGKMINQVRRFCKQQLRISVFLLLLTWPGLNVDIRGSLQMYAYFMVWSMLWLAVVGCSFISIPISYHLTTLPTDKFHIIRLAFVNRHIERSSTEQSCLFISIRFTLLEEVWIWDNWETLIYAFGRQGTELKVKFLSCNLTNLPCLCCPYGEFSSFQYQWSLRC